METETNVNIDEIGYIAKMLDSELTIFERMKIKKSSLKKVSGAIVFYLTTMIGTVGISVTFFQSEPCFSIDRISKWWPERCMKKFSGFLGKMELNRWQ